MTDLKGTGKKGRAGFAATYIHALILLLSIIALPGESFEKSYDNRLAIGVSDSGPDSSLDDLSVAGDQPSDELHGDNGTYGHAHGRRLGLSNEAPHRARDARAFHARGPPTLTV